MEFYSYLWLREDGSPYYVGKGSGRRAYGRCNHGHLHPPKDLSRIVLFPQDSEAAAFKSEQDLIALFGRKDLGTGCLRNLTDGGEGASGYKPPEEVRQRWSEMRMGHPGWNKGIPPSEETKQKISISNQGHVVLPETRDKISKSHFGLKHRADSKLKMSLQRKGRPSPWKGKTASDETRKQQSTAAKNRWKNMSAEKRQQFIEQRAAKQKAKRELKCQILTALPM